MSSYYIGVLRLSCVLATASAALGCGSSGDGGEAVDDVQLAIASVPVGVQCVKVVVGVAMQTVNPPLLTVATGASSASLGLGRLPAGAAVFNASAYDVACASVTASTVPSWVADPASSTLQPGVPTRVEMTFRKNNPVVVNANFLDNVAEITPGNTATYARLSDGTVKQWGRTGVTTATTPVFVTASNGTPLANVAKVAAGSGFACALKTDGTLWCWGDSYSGQVGPGVGFTTAANPVQVPLAGGPVLDVAAGWDFTCAVNSSGLWCWGGNSFGQLARAFVGPATNTPAVGSTGTYSKVFANGYTACALNEDGLYCWGANDYGQVGNGTTGPNRPVPSQVIQSGAVFGIPVDVSLGAYHACAVRGDGTLHCWGANFYGQLGDGTFTARSIAAPVDGVFDASRVTGGTFHTCLKHQDNSVNCWGSNFDGELGDGGVPFRNTLGGTVLTGVNNLQSKGQSTCATLANLNVMCWGNNGAYQLGDGTNVSRALPTPVKLQ